MQIGTLLRSVIGENYGNEQRTIALKPGQIVRATVLQHVQNNEAIVSVQGVPIRIGLEQSIPEGHTALLQVVEGDDGQFIMRIAPQSSGSMPQSVPAFLQQYGWPNQSSAYPLVQMILQEGLLLNESDARSLYMLFSNKPRGVSNQQWNETLIALLKRNLPLSMESAQAIRQVLFGSPMQNLLTELERNLDNYNMRLPLNDGQANTGQGRNERISILLTSIQQIIANVKQTSAQILQKRSITAFPFLRQHAETLITNSNLSPAAPVSDLQAGVSSNVRHPAFVTPLATEEGFVNDAAIRGRVEVLNAGQMNGVLPHRSAIQLTESIVRQMVTFATSLANSQVDAEINGQASARMLGALQLTSMESRSHLSMPVNDTNLLESAMRTADRSVQVFRPSLLGIFSPEAEHVSPASSAQRAGQEVAIQNSPDPLIQQMGSIRPASESTGGNAIIQLLKMIGLDYESSLHQHLRMNDGLLQMGFPQDGSFVRSEESMATLKTMLLQLQQMDELPVTLRESAQQLLQHITGQQLLLAQDRQAMMTHMMLLIPIMNEDGEQTAAISIQSRRPKKGMIDADNCRLLFDLSMRTLGNTIIDVKVVEKRVFLSILNDYPQLDALVQMSKSSLQSALHSIGYEVQSIQTGAYPKTTNNAGNKVAGSSTSLTRANGDDAKRSWHSISDYRGVDVRI